MRKIPQNICAILNGTALILFIAQSTNSFIPKLKEKPWHEYLNLPPGDWGDICSGKARPPLFAYSYKATFYAFSICDHYHYCHNSFLHRITIIICITLPPHQDHYWLMYISSSIVNIISLDCPPKFFPLWPIDVIIGVDELATIWIFD